MILSAFVLTMSLSAQSVIVNTSNYKQTIDMIGGDMERSSKAIQNAQNKDEIIQWSFGDINFNVCRVQYDKNQEMVEGTKNWAFYDKQVATMQAIKSVNPNIKFFATMRSDYDGYGDDNNLPDWIVNYNTKVMQTDKYGIFLADYCEYMSKQGVPISILSTSKEWMWHVRPDKVPDILSKMYSELDARGIERPLISDQGFWSISQGITYLNYVNSLGTKDLYHSFCSHNYANESNDKWVEIIEMSQALGKPMYDDETSTGSGSPTYGVERDMYKQIGEYIKKANRYAAGLSGEIYFEIWSRGIDQETRSIYFPANGTGTRLRGYYMMKHFSNNILDSRYVTSTVAGMSNVYTITFRKDDQVVLWVINKSETAVPRFFVGVDAFEIDGPVNVHYWTDDTPIEGSTNTLYAIGNKFETGISGEGMSCFIFNVKDEPDNLALSGTASQSSTDGEGIAAKAIDGNGDGAYENGSVSLTTSEENPWWQVDLGANDTIGTIAIFNRTDDCCKANLSNFTVSVINSENVVTFTETFTTAPDSSIMVDAGNVIGQRVKIQINGTAPLALAEVQVFEGNKSEKLDQTITFPALGTVAYTSEPLAPGATVNSGLNLSYSSSNTDVATIVDGKIQLKAVGTTTITASISGSAIYNAAADVSQTLTVVKAYQTITFDALPVKQVGDASFLPGATASSGLDIVYSSSNEAVARIEDSRIVIIGEGVSTISATQAGNDLYHEAVLYRELTVEKSEGGTGNSSVVTLSPIHDAYVRGGSYAGNNYGSETELLIKETSNLDFKRMSYLQFDVYDVDQLEKATLRLYAKSAKTSQIVVSGTTDDWTEGTITYSNAPKAGSAIGSQAVNTADKYYEWDVTAYVSAQMSGDDLASFIITDIATDKNNIGFYSKEAGSNMPELVITRVNVANQQITANHLFKCYPNPANDFVILSAEHGMDDVQISTLSGQFVFQKNAFGQKQYTVNLDGFPKGVYLCRIKDQKGNETVYNILVK